PKSQVCRNTESGPSLSELSLPNLSSKIRRRPINCRSPTIRHRSKSFDLKKQVPRAQPINSKPETFPTETFSPLLCTFPIPKTGPRAARRQVAGERDRSSRQERSGKRTFRSTARGARRRKDSFRNRRG